MKALSNVATISSNKINDTRKTLIYIALYIVLFLPKEGIPSNISTKYISTSFSAPYEDIFHHTPPTPPHIQTMGYKC